MFFVGCHASGVDASGTDHAFTLHYDLNGGDGPAPEAQRGEVLTVAPGTGLTKSGQNFKCWIPAPADKVYIPGEEIDLTADVVLYAWYSGNGTEDDPYVILNSTDLEAVANAPAAFYKVFNDFVISGEWTTLDIQFTGEIDGSGHTITFDNVTIKEIEETFSGYRERFCALIAVNGKGGVIKNLVFDGDVSMAFTSGLRAGGIVANNLGLITNCGVKTSYTIETAEGISFGAYCGSSQAERVGAKISNSFVSGDIDITHTGTQYHTMKVGGFTGAYAGLKIENCYSESNITVSYTNEACSVLLGGIVGTDDNYGNTIDSCYTMGTITATGFSGTIAGIKSGGTYISNSVALNTALSGGDSRVRISVQNMSNKHNSNVYGRDGMLGTLSGEDNNGISVTFEATQVKNWWRTAVAWTFSEPSPWRWDATKLRPVLYWQ
jgi:hypothetical protein